MHIKPALSKALGDGLPLAVRLQRPIPQIGASAGMVFKRDGVAWTNPAIEDGIMGWRIKEGLATGELVAVMALAA